MRYQWRAKDHTIEVTDTNGVVVASAWVEFDLRAEHEYRAYLHGEVVPEYRRQGLGSYMMNWMESQAHQFFATLPNDRPCVLRIMFTDSRQDAVELYEKFGFQFFLAEDEMHRDLKQPIPSISLPTGMNFVPWSPGYAFQVYNDAFRDRPGFPNWTEAVWRQNFTGFDTFRPELSLMVMAGEQPAAYAVSAVESNQGWIVQMGVRPAFRNKGVGGTVLAEAMRRFKTEGLDTAALEVNVNNPQAARLYERFGFVLVKRVTIYHKVVR